MKCGSVVAAAMAWIEPGSGISGAWATAMPADHSKYTHTNLGRSIGPPGQRRKSSRRVSEGLMRGLGGAEEALASLRGAGQWARPYVFRGGLCVGSNYRRICRPSEAARTLG